MAMPATRRSFSVGPGWAPSSFVAAASVLLCLSLQLGAQDRVGTPVPVAAPATATAGDRIFQTTKLHRIHVSVSAAEWAVLQTSSARGGAGNGRGGLGPQLDVMRPLTGDQPLIYWLLDDPAIAAQYRAIVRELGTAVFTATELSKMVDALEKVGTGRDPSPREFIATRTAYVEQILTSLDGK
jgi:hypothetical protein